MPHAWLAHVSAHVDGLPPTLPGLRAALNAADQAALLLAQASGRTQLNDPAAAAAVLCSAALGSVESTAHRASGTPRLPLEPPDEPQDQDHLRALGSLLHECIGLAMEVLDSEDEHLDACDVREISSAVDMLSRARAHCVGAPR